MIPLPMKLLVRLAVGVVLLAAILFALSQCQSARNARTEARLSDNQAEAVSQSARDAIGTAGAVAGRDAGVMTSQGAMTMRSGSRRGPMLPLTLAPLVLGLTACANGPPIVAASSACSALLPPEWRSPVPGAPLPSGETVGDWIAFADAQTGQLDRANDRTVSAIGIVERCEARGREAVEAAGKHWWQVWR